MTLRVATSGPPRAARVAYSSLFSLGDVKKKKKKKKEEDAEEEEEEEEDAEEEEQEEQDAEEDSCSVIIIIKKTNSFLFYFCTAAHETRQDVWPVSCRSGSPRDPESRYVGPARPPALRTRACSRSVM